MPADAIFRTERTYETNAGRTTGTLEVPPTFGVQEQTIYIYNISTRAFKLQRPPNHSKLYFRPCPKGEPFTLVMEVGHPFRETDYDTNTGTAKIVLRDGSREATGILNPDHPVFSDLSNKAPLPWQIQDADLRDNNGNYCNYGLFWSYNNPPTEAEVIAARVRLEKTYKRELERMSKAKTAEEAMAMRNDVSTAAAEYYKRTGLSWYMGDLNTPADAGKVDCGVCGEKIQPTAKLCIHCGAPTDEAKQAAWLESRFEQKRGPGRPAGQKD
jgi:hypothetical protein